MCINEFSEHRQVLVVARWLNLLIIIALLLGPWSSPASAQTEDPFIQQMLDRMTVAEKVGQLFIVTFAGNDVGADSDVGRLILDYKIGGIVLTPANGNFVNNAMTPRQVVTLTNALQTLAFRPTKDSGTAGPIPLFIAAEHEGDGYPYTAIRGGMTPVPSAMAIGATWPGSSAQSKSDENYAQQVGQIVGRELRAVGVNLLLGPSLDILNSPRPGLKGDLGVRSFGGDPYWVGKLGKAYIRGVHASSQGRVATIATHFPGNGGSDRSPDDEIATVEKSIQELTRIELAPFIAVTQGDPDNLGVTDGLMSSHIRYRGFQGNIRQLTRPISFDAAGLQALMNLKEFANWRPRGIILSDSLGVPAVRQYYDPQLKNFPAKSIAQDALLAGNDLLYLSRFALNDNWPEQLANIQATIQFFREQYTRDQTFKARVNSALRRILTLKRRLYADFNLKNVLVDPEQLAKEVGQGKNDVAQIGEKAVTLIYPGANELADRLPSPPRREERILIITDARQVTDCPACEPFPLIAPDALQQTILQLYGPKATGQIAPEQISSLTFNQLKAFLQPSEQFKITKDEQARIERLIRNAEWIIFAMLDLNPVDYPASDALKVFLRQRTDLRDKKIVALAFNAPYYLDTTEISKLTAYYGVFSKVSPFIDAAVRALFQGFPAQGASPVSIAGINYELVTQLEPNPTQSIRPLLNSPTPPGPIQVGTTLRVRTTPILDHNGHRVPDGTPVTFRPFYPRDSVYLSPTEATTVDGIAEAAILAERPGLLQITAVSGGATTSEADILALTIQGDREVTATPSPIPTSTPTPIPPTPTPDPTHRPGAPGSRSGPMPNWGALILSLVAIGFGSGGAFARRRRPTLHLSREVRLLLVSIATGLFGYILASTFLAGILPMPGTLSVPLVSLGCALLPFFWPGNAE